MYIGTNTKIFYGDSDLAIREQY